MDKENYSNSIWMDALPFALYFLGEQPVGNLSGFYLI